MFIRLLLLASLLAVPLVATDAAQPALTATPAPAADQTTQWTYEQPRFAWVTPTPKADSAVDADGICYKIRAYIFNRDDDHAPELKGSTTCVANQPRAKTVVWPKARLVPAD